MTGEVKTDENNIEVKVANFIVNNEKCMKRVKSLSSSIKVIKFKSRKSGNLDFPLYERNHLYSK